MFFLCSALSFVFVVKGKRILIAQPLAPCLGFTFPRLSSSYGVFFCLHSTLPSQKGLQTLCAAPTNPSPDLQSSWFGQERLPLSLVCGIPAPCSSLVSTTAMCCRDVAFFSCVAACTAVQPERAPRRQSPLKKTAGQLRNTTTLKLMHSSSTWQRNINCGKTLAKPRHASPSGRG